MIRSSRSLSVLGVARLRGRGGAPGPYGAVAQDQAADRQARSDEQEGARRLRHARLRRRQAEAARRAGGRARRPASTTTRSWAGPTSTWAPSTSPASTNRQGASQSFGRALEIDPPIQLSKGIETAEVDRGVRRGPAQRARRSRLVGRRRRRRRRAAAAPRRSGAARSWRGTTRRAPRTISPKPKKRHRDERRGARSAGPHRRARLPGARRGDPRQAARRSAARWPPTCRWPASTCMYRAPGKEDYNEVLMTKTPKGWLQAKIPKKAVDGQVDPVLLRGAQRGRQAGGRQRRRRQPEHRAGRRGGGRGRGLQGAAATRRTRTRSRRTRATSGRSSTSGTSTTRARGSTPATASASGGLGSASAPATATPRGTGSRRSTSRPRRSRRSLQRHHPGFHCLQFQPGLALAGLGQLVPEFGYALHPRHGAVARGALQYTGIPSKYSQFAAKGAIGVLAKLHLLHEAVAAPLLRGGPGGRRQLPLRRLSRRRRTTQRLLRFQGHRRRRPAPGRRGRRPLLRGEQGGVARASSCTSWSGFPTFGAVTDLQRRRCSSISTQSAAPASKAYVPTGSDQEEPK